MKKLVGFFGKGYSELPCAYSFPGWLWAAFFSKIAVSLTKRGAILAKRVDIRDFGREFRGYSKKLGKEFNRIVANQVVRAIPRLVEKSPVDTGEYANSWDFTADEKKIILGNFAPHATIIEFGARPFKPPIQPLLEWARRVLQDTSPAGEFSPDVRRLAYATQKKIERQGMKPHHILTNEIPVIIEEIKKEVSQMKVDP